MDGDGVVGPLLQQVVGGRELAGVPGGRGPVEGRLLLARDLPAVVGRPYQVVRRRFIQR